MSSTELNFSTSISVRNVMSRIDDHLAQVRQWEKNGSYDLCFMYKSMAKSLIELLEVDHCGALGGLQLNFPKGKDSLQKRRDYLYGVLLEGKA